MCHLSCRKVEENGDNTNDTEFEGEGEWTATLILRFHHRMTEMSYIAIRERKRIQK